MLVGLCVRSPALCRVVVAATAAELAKAAADIAKALRDHLNSCPNDDGKDEDEEVDCFDVQLDCYASLGGPHGEGRRSITEQAALMHACIKAKAPQCL